MKTESLTIPKIRVFFTINVASKYAYHVGHHMHAFGISQEAAEFMVDCWAACRSVRGEGKRALSPRIGGSV